MNFITEKFGQHPNLAAPIVVLSTFYRGNDLVGVLADPIAGSRVYVDK